MGGSILDQAYEDQRNAELDAELDAMVTDYERRNPPADTPVQPAAPTSKDGPSQEDNADLWAEAPDRPQKIKQKSGGASAPPSGFWGELRAADQSFRGRLESGTVTPETNPNAAFAGGLAGTAGDVGETVMALGPGWQKLWHDTQAFFLENPSGLPRDWQLMSDESEAYFSQFPQPDAGEITGAAPFRSAEESAAAKKSVQKAQLRAAVQDARLRAALPTSTDPLRQGVIDATFNIGMMVPSLVAGFATKNPALAVSMMSSQTGISSYGDARRAGAEPGQAYRYGVTMGAIEGLTEIIPAKLLIGDFVKKTEFVEAFTKQLIADGLGEQAATHLQDLTTWLELNPDKTLDEFLAERPAAALRAAIASAFVSTALTGTMSGINALSSPAADAEAAPVPETPPDAAPAEPATPAATSAEAAPAPAAQDGAPSPEQADLLDKVNKVADAIDVAQNEQRPAIKPQVETDDQKFVRGVESALGIKRPAAPVETPEERRARMAERRANEERVTEESTDRVVQGVRDFARGQQNADTIALKAQADRALDRAMQTESSADIAAAVSAYNDYARSVGREQVDPDNPNPRRPEGAPEPISYAEEMDLDDLDRTSTIAEAERIAGELEAMDSEDAKSAASQFRTLIKYSDKYDDNTFWQGFDEALEYAAPHLMTEEQQAAVIEKVAEAVEAAPLAPEEEASATLVEEVRATAPASRYFGRKSFGGEGLATEAPAPEQASLDSLKSKIAEAESAIALALKDQPEDTEDYGDAETLIELRDESERLIRNAKSYTSKIELIERAERLQNAIEEELGKQSPAPPAAAPEAAPVARTSAKYEVETEDAGSFELTIIRLPDGSVGLIGPDINVNYVPAFAKGKTDQELMAYQFEPLGFKQATDKAGRAAAPPAPAAAPQPARLPAKPAPISDTQLAAIAAKEGKTSRPVQAREAMLLKAESVYDDILTKEVLEELDDRHDMNVRQVREVMGKAIEGRGSLDRFNTLMKRYAAIRADLDRQAAESGVQADFEALAAAQPDPGEGGLGRGLGSLMAEQGVNPETKFSADFEIPGSPQYEAAKAKGLDMSQAGRMARAKEQVFDTETVLYHGTGANIDAFNLSANGVNGPGVYLALDPNAASAYASRSGQGANVLPVFVKSGRYATTQQLDDLAKSLRDNDSPPAVDNSYVSAVERLKADGFIGVRDDKFVSIFDASNIRSVHAAFDPDLASSPNLLFSAGTSKRKPVADPEKNRRRLDARAYRDWGQNYLDLVQKGIVSYASAEEIAAMGFGSGNERAYYLRENGQHEVIINTSQTRTEHLEGILLHEIGWHAGLEGLVGRDNKEKILSEIDRLVSSFEQKQKNKLPTTRAERAAYSARQHAIRNAARPEHVREETGAYIAQHHVGNPLIFPIITQIKVAIGRRFPGIIDRLGWGSAEYAQLALVSLQRFIIKEIKHVPNDRAMPGNRSPRIPFLLEVTYPDGFRKLARSQGSATTPQGWARRLMTLGQKQMWNVIRTLDLRNVDTFPQQLRDLDKDLHSPEVFDALMHLDPDFNVGTYLQLYDDAMAGDPDAAYELYDILAPLKGLDLPVDIRYSRGAVPRKHADGAEIEFEQTGPLVEVRSQHGNIKGHIRNGALIISTSFVNEDQRGKGYGTDLYESLALEAENRGLVMISDRNVTNSAAGAWWSLARRGWFVLENFVEGGDQVGAGGASPMGMNPFVLVPPSLGLMDYAEAISLMEPPRMREQVLAMRDEINKGARIRKNEYVANMPGADKLDFDNFLRFNQLDIDMKRRRGQDPSSDIAWRETRMRDRREFLDRALKPMGLSVETFERRSDALLLTEVTHKANFEHYKEPPQISDAPINDMANGGRVRSAEELRSIRAEGKKQQEDLSAINRAVRMFSDIETGDRDLIISTMSEVMTDLPLASELNSEYYYPNTFTNLALAVMYKAANQLGPEFGEVAAQAMRAYGSRFSGDDKTFMTQSVEDYLRAVAGKKQAAGPNLEVMFSADFADPAPPMDPVMEEAYSKFFNFMRNGLPPENKGKGFILAAMSDPEVLARKGQRITLAETRLKANNADAIDALMRSRKGERLPESDVTAIRDFAETSLVRMLELAAELVDRPSDAVTLAAYQMAVKMHQVVLAEAQNQMAAASRIMNSGRIIAQTNAGVAAALRVDLNDPTAAGRLVQMASEMTKLDPTRPGNIRKINRAVEISTWEAWKQLGAATIRFMFLSWPPTHFVNALGNTLVMIGGISDHYIAGLKPGQQDLMEEASIRWTAMLQAMKHQVEYMDANSQFNPLKPNLSLQFDPVEVSGTNKWGEDQARALSAERIGKLTGGLYKPTSDDPIGAFADFLGYGLSAPSDALGVADDLFKGVNYTIALHGLAFREAREARRAGKITPEQEREHAQKLIEFPPDHIVKGAIAEAQENTFTRPVGQITQLALKGRGMADNALMFGTLKMPFIITPSNLFSFQFRRMPTGPLFPEWRRNYAAGGKKRALAEAQFAMGSMMLMAGWAAWSMGLLTGAGPEDPEKRKALMDTGWQPFAAVFGREHVQTNRLDPTMMPFHIGALFAETAANDGWNAKPDADWHELWGLSAIKFGQMMLDKSYLSGVASFIEALGSDGNAAERLGRDYQNSLVSAMTPAFLAGIRRIEDPHKRLVDDMFSKYRNRIPVFSNQVPPGYDVFGAPVTYQTGLARVAQIVNPFAISSVKEGAVYDEIERLKYIPSIMDKSISFPWAGKTYDVPLDERMDIYSEMTGAFGGNEELGIPNFRDRLNTMIESDDYKALSDINDPRIEGSKAKFISDYVENARTVIKKRIRFKHHDFLKTEAMKQLGGEVGLAKMKEAEATESLATQAYEQLLQDAK